MFPVNKDILGSGFMLMGGGSVLALARNIPSKIMRAIRNQFMVSVDIDSADELFELVCLWLDQHPYSKKSRTIRANLVGAKSNSLYPVAYEEDKNLIFTPARGSHFFWNNGKPIWLERTKEDTNPNQAGLVKLINKEAISIFTIGRSQARLRGIINECVAKSRQAQVEAIKLYSNSYDGWAPSCSLQKRSVDTLILEPGVWDEVAEDCKHFFASKKSYGDRGVPWRRGYLLRGIPGSGKSSLVIVLASALNVPVYTLNVSSETGDSDLVRMFRELPLKSFVLIEDVDALFEGRDKKNSASKLSFSGLLNALDGVGSSEGRMLFMTTNHPEKLDPALIRPGRVDVQLDFTYASSYQLEKLYTKINPDASDEETADFVTSFEKPVCMAEAQEEALKRMRKI